MFTRSEYKPVSIEDTEEGQEIARKQTNSRLPSRRALLIVVIVQFIVLAWSVLRGHTSTMDLPEIYSPASEAVEYQVKAFGMDKRFHGPPSDALDAAWDELYQFGISRIPKSQAALLPNKTLPIPDDEDHYIIELDVFHNLHCLNLIRKTLHSDYYTHMGMDMHGNAGHMDHCIDAIRQSLMCTADTSVIVWKWDESRQKNRFRSDITHTCRNFEKIREWGKEHALVVEYNDTIRLPDDEIVVPVIYS